MMHYSTTSLHCKNVPTAPPLSTFSLYSSSYSSSSLSPSSSSSSPLPQHHLTSSFPVSRQSYPRAHPNPKGMKVLCSKSEPIKVMISGAPASGKGTQCEMIVQKFGLVHISTGDLLRAEVSAGTEIGNKAKEYMDAGRLVPDEVVTAMVTARLSQQDAKEKGWLLDGYPRSFAQAQSLEKLNIRPDIYIVLDVPDEILIDRCVGRRLDPVTGKIYHIKNFPPETDEIKARLITRPDDTEQKIDGNRPKEVIFKDVDSLLSQVQKEKVKTTKPVKSTLQSKSQASSSQVEISIPELNPEMDVYRIGTLMELVRVLALNFADDGKRIKVCVQGSMGEGALAGMPLQLAGSRKILEYMDWGDYGAMGTFINIGSIGGKEVSEEDDMFILVAPQNAVGNCIIDDLRAMTDAAGSRPVILINPRLKDLPASSGIMQTMGRDKRLEYAASFENCYHFRLLYYAGTQYPIMGALRMSYPYGYELYKRVDDPSFGKEKYNILTTFPNRPDVDEINDTFEGKPR
ncbi:hypothetical protein C3L33_03742, partial [Rhododendron williamsianum]